MKTLSFVALAASLALNALIAALYLGGRPSASAPIPDASTSGSVAKPATAPGLNAEVWRGLASAQMPELVARLRAAGFPPAVVRAIAAAELRESFAARRKALTAGYDTGPHWQNPIRDPQTQAALHALDREMQKSLRALLGTEGENTDPVAQFQRERGLEFLAAEKAEELRQILRDYNDRRSDIYAAGYNFTTDRHKIETLEKEQQAAIARALTPAEYFEFTLRQGRTADRLRDELSAFNPTEEEYRAIFKARAPFDEQYGDFTPAMSQEEMRRRSDAERLMKEQIKAVLPPARAADYERMTDYNYRRTSQLVARLELPPNTTDQLYAVQKEFEQRRNELYRGVRSAAERDAITGQLRGLQQEATAKVTPILGNARAVEAYRQYGGTWISSLVPRPPPPAAKK